MSTLLTHRYTVLYLGINLLIGIWFVTGARQYPEGPALFPTIMGWGLISVVVMHTIIEAIRARKPSPVPSATDSVEEEEPTEKEKFGWWTIATPVAIFAFVFAVPHIGLYPAIAIFLLITLPISGQKKWYLVLITIASVILGTYLVFDYLLGVPIPSGNIF